MLGSVLIAGPIPTIRIKLAAEFKAAHYAIVPVASGAETFRAISAERPDVVVLDSSIALEPAPEARRNGTPPNPGPNPGPKSGPCPAALRTGTNLCQRIRQRLPDCPVIVLCAPGQTTHDDRAAALRSGAAEVFTTDVHPTLLLAGVRRAIRASLAEAVARRKEAEGRALGLSDPPAALDYPGTIGWLCLPQFRETPSTHALPQLIPDAIHPLSVDGAMSTETKASACDVLVLDAERATPLEALGMISELASRGDSHRAAIVVILPADTSAHLAAQAFDLGASEVMITAPDPQELALRLRRQVTAIQRREALRNGVKRGLKLAVTDTLTGLYNRRYAMTHLAQMLQTPPDPGTRHALMMLDLDHFKQVNDTYGHGAGDIILRECAKTLLGTLRGRDLLARFGGEEFLVLIPNINPSDLESAANRLRRALEQADLTLPGKSALHLRQTVSIGAALSQSGVSGSELVDRADQALYRAKSGGRNRVCLAPTPARKPRRSTGDSWSLPQVQTVLPRA